MADLCAVIVRFAAFAPWRACESACSLPSTPTCKGTHCIETLSPSREGLQGGGGYRGGYQHRRHSFEADLPEKYCVKAAEEGEANMGHRANRDKKEVY